METKDAGSSRSGFLIIKMSKRIWSLRNKKNQIYQKIFAIALAIAKIEVIQTEQLQVIQKTKLCIKAKNHPRV